jgi:membrane-associated phospholipid phosphatase
MLAWGAVVVGVATPLVRHRLKLRAPVVSALTWPAPAALALAAPRTPLRDAGIYALQMWAYFAHFDMPDDDPDALLRRLRVDYPIRADEALGCGVAPTVRLQRALGRPGHVGKLEYGLSIVHWSWFIVPHGTLAYILLRHRRVFPRSVGAMTVCFDLGCVVYWLVPTAPPWWAGQNGNMPPVRRIMAEAGERFWKRLWQPLYSSLQGNPFAAMPSLHFGTSVMAARVLSQVGRGHATAGWAYALTLGFGLVYLGEHYLIDLLAGFALAEAIWRLAPHVEPALVPLGRLIQQLEPRAG